MIENKTNICFYDVLANKSLIFLQLNVVFLFNILFNLYLPYCKIKMVFIGKYLFRL